MTNSYDARIALKVARSANFFALYAKPWEKPKFLLPDGEIGNEREIYNYYNITF